MTTLTEIAPDVFRMSCFNAQGNFQFNSFLIRDEEPVLVHTNLRANFDDLRGTVAKVVDPARLRWIWFSHFEPDECGSLNDWLGIAPNATPVCSFVAARVAMGDFSIRPPKVVGNETLNTGKRRLRVIDTPHVPHGWDASMLFEETERTMFVSDLFGHGGDVEPIISGDLVGRCETYTVAQMAGPMAHSTPYTARTTKILAGLSALEPRTLAAMHGSSYAGDGAKALTDLDAMWQRTIAKA
jgi:flavorubredoxin